MTQNQIQERYETRWRYVPVLLGPLLRGFAARCFVGCYKPWELSGFYAVRDAWDAAFSGFRNEWGYYESSLRRYAPRLAAKNVGVGYAW